MNYADPELIEKLAAEFVLGTLKGLPRQRFEKLMMESYSVRLAVWQWEQELTPLASTLPSVVPSKSIWKEIQKRISNDAYVVDQPRNTESFWSRWLWPSWSVLASVTLFAVLFVFTPNIEEDISSPTELTRVAIINNETADPLWLVSLDTNAGQFSVTAVNQEAQFLDDKAYELWMLPNDGSPPKSLGLMPTSIGKQDWVLSPQILSQLSQNQGLAVSLEPRGGSKTGLPTGPILYESKLYDL